jgi:hypothetical protein
VAGIAGPEALIGGLTFAGGFVVAVVEMVVVVVVGGAGVVLVASIVVGDTSTWGGDTSVVLDGLVPMVVA